MRGLIISMTPMRRKLLARHEEPNNGEHSLSNLVRVLQLQTLCGKRARNQGEEGGDIGTVINIGLSKKI